jgi:hypothetical protein
MGHSAEPDPDRGDVDGSAPDEVALVEPGGDGAVVTESAEGALDGVALLVPAGVDGGRAESVNLGEAPVAGFYRVAASVSCGGLIEAVAGILGGWGGLLVKRSGWAV